MTGNGVVDTILLIAAILGGVVTIGTAGWRIWRFLDGWEDAFSTLRGIADEFKPNGGTSLHDRITHLDSAVSQIQRDIESVMIERPHRESSVRAEVEDPMT